MSLTFVVYRAGSNCKVNKHTFWVLIQGSQERGFHASIETPEPPKSTTNYNNYLHACDITAFSRY